MDPPLGLAPSGIPRFPRTRGDGPYRWEFDQAEPKLPPHARGWTPLWGWRRVAYRASPARAGMDPTDGSSTRLSRSFPRTRGDGPAGHGRLRPVDWLPPHARGWTLTYPWWEGGVGASPARAGMDLEPARSTFGSICFPRTRGDGPRVMRRMLMIQGLPPHARGWTAAPPRCAPVRGASPARAGMDRRRTRRRARRNCFPRTRGDGPPSWTMTREETVLPPHARGWTRVTLAANLGPRASPARAGMDRLPARSKAG